MKNKNLGFTLTETLVAIVIGMISVAAAFSSYNFFNKSYGSVSQKAAISKSAREGLTMIARDLRNTGYYHVNFENNNCEALRENQYDYIGITHNKKWINGKYKQSDGLMTTYSVSAKERVRIQYFLKQYQNSSDYYLMRILNINPIGHSRSGCGQWTRSYNMPVDDEILVPFVEDFQVIPKDIEGNIVFPVCTSCSSLENSNGGQVKSKENMRKVHTVEVYLTVRSPKEVYKNSRKVKIQNGEAPYGSNINVPADKYHRETFFISVHTRNLATPQAKIASSGQSIGIGTGYNK